MLVGMLGFCTKRTFPKKGMLFRKEKGSYGKPGQPQTGLGGTNPYKNVIYVDIGIE